MKKITTYRFLTESIYKSSRYRYGDLYGMCYLKEFKNEIWQVKPVLGFDPIYKKPGNINLYCICDSYLYSFINSDSLFCGVSKLIISRWVLDGPMEIDLDKSKTNILLIERVERHFLSTSLSDYCRQFIVVEKKKTGLVEGIKDVIQEAAFFIFKSEEVDKIHNLAFNKNIEQNLEFNLFDYAIFDIFKETKAALNYKIFGRTSKGASIIPGYPYLFFSETLDSSFKNNSFSQISDFKIKSMVDTLNLTFQYYRNAGFDYVFTSIIPNPVSIVCPGYGKYNDLIRRVQNHPDLQMPMINTFNVFADAKCQVFSYSDSHWTSNGFILWVNNFNRYLNKTLKAE